jgi:antitoxin component of MazEF toxin-antitoxin module
MTAKIMATVKFVAKISKMGNRKLVINIPKDFFKQVDDMIGKQLKITINDEI